MGSPKDLQERVVYHMWLCVAECVQTAVLSEEELRHLTK